MAGNPLNRDAAQHKVEGCDREPAAVKRVLLPILLGVMLGLVLAAVWLGPAAINAIGLDPERYRPQITATLAETLGRPVDIEGRLSIELTPGPSLILRGVRLEGEPSALLEVAEVRAALEPLALLQGRLSVTALELHRPLLAALPLAGDAAGWARRGSSGLGLQRIAVRDGLVVRGDEDRTALVSNLQADVEAAEIGAPYRLKGEGDWRSGAVPLGFEGALATSSGGTIPVSLAVRVRGAKAEARLSGQLGGEGLRGKINVSGDNLNALLERFGAGVVLPPAGNSDFALQATVAVTADGMMLEPLDGRIGDSRATGSLRIGSGETATAAAVLSFSNLDLDQWLAGAPAPMAPELWRPLLRRMPLALDVSADVLTVRRSVLRQARLDARFDGETVRLEQLAAMLPGNSSLRASGSATLTTPQVDLSFEAASDNLRAVLDWLGIAVASVPPERLRVMAMSGHLSGTPEQLALSDVDLKVDTAHLTGAATLRLGARLGIGINLATPALNLDAYGRRGAGAVDMAALRTALGSFDANLRAAVGVLTVNDTPVRDLLVDGTLINGELNLRQVSVGEVAGAALRLAGRIDGLTRGAIEPHGLRFDLKAADPDRLGRLLDLALPFPADRLGPVTAGGTVDGDSRLLSFQSQVAAAGAALTLAGSVADPAGRPRWDLKLSARHDSVAGLARLAAPDYRPAGGLGAFGLDATLSGTAAELAASDVHVRLGATVLEGLGYLTLTGKPVVTASLTAAGPVDLTGFLPADKPGRGWSKEPLDLGWLRGFDGTLSVDAPSLAWDRQRLDQPSLRLALRDGTLELELLQGLVGDGRLSAHGTVTADGGIELDGTLEEARPTAPLLRVNGIELAGGRMSTTLHLRSEGRSPFEMQSRLSGSARLEVRDGALTGFTLGEISHKLARAVRPGDVPSLLQAGMAQGRTPFSRLSARFVINSGVVASEDLALEAEGGGATAVITQSLPAGTIDARAVFRLTDQPQAPGFVMTLDGSVDHPRRNFDAAELEAWVAAKPGKVTPAGSPG
jgi:uncharacterized protein involved in outer membrane biogenesis